MSEMIDRVAVALIDADPTMLGHHETHIEAKRKAARAAIEAMREPTGDMKSAGRLRAEHDSVASIWRAMIGAALAEVATTAKTP
jgi:hypothetical protein